MIIEESLKEIEESYSKLIENTCDDRDQASLNSLGADLAVKVRETSKIISPEIKDEDIAVIFLVTTKIFMDWYSQAVIDTDNSMFYGVDKLKEAMARESAVQDVVLRFASGLYHFVKTMVTEREDKRSLHQERQNKEQL